jgi:hypothetical protein
MAVFLFFIPAMRQGHSRSFQHFSQNSACCPCLNFMMKRCRKGGQSTRFCSVKIIESVAKYAVWPDSLEKKR